MKKYLVIPCVLIVLFLGIRVLLTSSNMLQMTFALIGMLLVLFGIFKEYGKADKK
ncbi:hypothetical protein ACVRW7_09990 [Streptococcus ratti]|uniref:Uncharacterized protein n=1 Tax=Streptococcus ratti FA-1 = DSM 20564 TaxID=699248 RepID=A0ABP2R0T5_STRRT|nr:hypothetical protein [Streptococcus ratti]EJN94954.1 hypothetical protein SRA_01182 [Streptococcus ratti FA-1 = DSM 20564]